MRRIVRDLALCLRVRPLRESSKLVTFFTKSDGRLVCIAKGARRPKSRFGAALEPFAVSEITWYRHQQKTIYPVSEATLISSHPGIVAEPARFLAAEQVGEFLLRTSSDHDPNEQLWRLALTYLGEIERADAALPVLVTSFLLKAASFLGFRPELRNCLVCRCPLPAASNPARWRFDVRRGGAICPDCGTAPDAPVVSVEQLTGLADLLYSPAAGLAGGSAGADDAASAERLGLVRAFLAHHIDRLLLNSFNWREL
ncbi:MAG TPA: DNA repair protein RecO [candidate division WOR-3 bacterium]|uniref:DNA repair protein RecO n=1 Tax=candidate division WOR-3 bacterium TaxID=2052148 RepID=A0A7V0T4H9_UNCW3|nr:DNA repair protein RecO [candidate division WOR-3 bacterium]